MYLIFSLITLPMHDISHDVLWKTDTNKDHLKTVKLICSDYLNNCSSKPLFRYLYILYEMNKVTWMKCKWIK